MSLSQRLRETIEHTSLQVPGSPNALFARLVEQAGFQATYLSGAAFSAGQFALPDIGLFTLTELAQETARISKRIKIPVIVDADTGFGEAVNVERTIVELESAGAAAIQLEDQRLPKRCGHLSGKTLVETEEMCAKIRSAVGAKQDESTIIIARTDARAVEGFDQAIDRANQYVRAGADWIFPEALNSKQEFERFSQAMNVPLIANMTEFGKSPLLPFGELQQLGFAVVLYPVTLLRLAAKAVEKGLSEILENGTQSGMLDQMQTRAELYELLEYKQFEDRDRINFGGTKRE